MEASAACCIPPDCHLIWPALNWSYHGLRGLKSSSEGIVHPQPPNFCGFQPSEWPKWTPDACTGARFALASLHWERTPYAAWRMAWIAALCIVRCAACTAFCIMQVDLVKWALLVILIL